MTARVGARHESEASPPEKTVEVIGDAELAEDAPTQVDVNGLPVVLVRHQGAVYALADLCPHLGCSLAQGTLDGDAIVCGCHGSTFALVDGRVLKGPSTYPVTTYKTTKRNGSILSARQSKPRIKGDRTCLRRQRSNGSSWERSSLANGPAKRRRRA